MKEKMPPYSIVDNTIYVMFNNELIQGTVTRKILETIENEDWTLLYNIMTKKLDKQIVESSLVKLNIINGMLAGRKVPDVIIDKILQLYNNDMPIKPLMRFIDNLLNNPYPDKIEDVFNFIQEHKEFPLTNDGAFLAWKKVQNDLYSFFHNSDGEKLYYGIGETVSLPESEVDHNSNKTCSNGIHACAKSYLSEYYGDEGTVVIVKIFPQDVRAVPSDYNHAKLRCVKLQVLDFADSETIKDAFETKGIYYTSDEELEDDWEDDWEEDDLDDDWDNDLEDDWEDEDEEEDEDLEDETKILETPSKNSNRIIKKICEYIQKGEDTSFRRISKNLGVTYEEIESAATSTTNLVVYRTYPAMGSWYFTEVLS